MVLPLTPCTTHASIHQPSKPRSKGLGYAHTRKSAPLFAAGPFCLKTLREQDASRPRRGRFREDAPEVVPTDRALQTGADVGMPIVLAQLWCLVHPAVAVAQVGGLRIPEVDA